MEICNRPLVRSRLGDGWICNRRILTEESEDEQARGRGSKIKENSGHEEFCMIGHVDLRSSFEENKRRRFRV